MVCWFVSVPPPLIWLFVLLDIVTMPPDPAKVVLPAIDRNVPLFPPPRLIAPLFVIVPAPRLSVVLLRTFTALPVEIVTVLSVKLSVSLMEPPAVLVSVPPVILPVNRLTVAPVPVDRIVPPVLVTPYVLN